MHFKEKWYAVRLQLKKLNALFKKFPPKIKGELLPGSILYLSSPLSGDSQDRQIHNHLRVAMVI